MTVVERNAHDQPVGARLDGWVPPPLPPRTVLAGRTVVVVPLDAAAHAAALDAAFADDDAGWTYLPYGPFADPAAHAAWLQAMAAQDDPLFVALCQPDGTPVGLASYLRITPAAGSIEVGHIHVGRQAQRSSLVTEAMFLLMRQAFALGYRRYEWKCDALNAPSRAAALRLGFAFEGIFRQATVVKGRNRDTSWYAVLDREWPALEQAFVTWLDPANVDDAGRQRQSLSALTMAVRAAWR
jgi:RimJ/RimL family protein N-acetyltransferase